MMQGVWEKVFRESVVARVGRIYGLKPAATLANRENLMSRMERLPMGAPVMIQNADGSPIYIAGMDGPLS